MFGRKRMLERIRMLEAQVADLRAALDFYADGENWKRRGVHPKGSPVRFAMSPLTKDHGGRARAALLRPRMGGKRATVPAALTDSATGGADVLS